LRIVVAKLNVKTIGTLAGCVAILMWGTLGLLGSLSSDLPPYFILTVCFTIAGSLGAILCWKAGVRPADIFKLPMLFYTALLSFYHLSYLEAFHHAPSLPVSLINYLWPALFILIGNTCFNLGSGNAGFLGAAIGFSGIFILIAGGELSLNFAEFYGYGLAFIGAALWALYSNLRRKDTLPVISSMTTICFGAAVFCGSITLASASDVPDISVSQWVVILSLGFGPAGGAFFLWDYGMKIGDAALLGVLGYSAPLISTFLMIAFGLGEFTWNVIAATSLIVSGGLILHFGTKSKQNSHKGCSS